MPVLTFRVTIPNATPARTPITHDLISIASAIHSLMIWTNSSNGGIDECGYQLTNRLGTMILPDAGSHDQFVFGNAEDGWSPIPPQPFLVPMFDQILEGPPYTLQFKFYNVDAAPVIVGGYVIVREPLARLAEEAAIYQFLQSKAPSAEPVSPETLTRLDGKEKKKGVDISKARIDMQSFLRDNNPLAKKTNLKVEKK